MTIREQIDEVLKGFKTEEERVYNEDAVSQIFGIFHTQEEFIDFTFDSENWHNDEGYVMALSWIDPDSHRLELKIIEFIYRKEKYNDIQEELITFVQENFPHNNKGDR